MELVAVAFWGLLLWLALRWLTGGSRRSRRAPATPTPPRHRGVDDVPGDGAFVDGLVIGTYVTHRHYRDRLDEQATEHARELEDLEEQAWLLGADDVGLDGALLDAEEPDGWEDLDALEELDDGEDW